MSVPPTMAGNSHDSQKRIETERNNKMQIEVGKYVLAGCRTATGRIRQLSFDAKRPQRMGENEEEGQIGVA